MYLNKAYILGNLTRDPEMRSLPSGIPVTNFSVATNHRYKDKEGNWQEQTEYHNVTVFGKQAESCNQYLKKGSQVLVEGRIGTRSWEKDGVKQYRTEINAERVQFGSNPEKKAREEVDKEFKEMGRTSPSEDFPDGINPEDIPF